MEHIEILQHFEYDHLHYTRMKEVSSRFYVLAHELVELIEGGAERSVALRKLLEAKDAAVRQARVDIIAVGGNDD